MGVLELAAQGAGSTFANASDGQMTNRNMNDCHNTVGVLSHSPLW